jgi:hypothetical protein
MKIVSDVDTDMQNEFQVPRFVSKMNFRPTFQTDRYQTEKLFSARMRKKKERGFEDDS